MPTPTASPPDRAPGAPGAPRKMTERRRWSLWVDQPVKEAAAARAKAEGRDLAEVVRDALAKYAKGGKR